MYHNGTIPKTAKFGHYLYCQGGDPGSGRWTTSYDWRQRKWTELGPEDRETLLPDKVWEFRRMFRNIDAKRARQLAIEADFDVKVPAAARNLMDIARTRGTELIGTAPVRHRNPRIFPSDHFWLRATVRSP